MTIAQSTELANRFPRGSRVTSSEKSALMILLGEEVHSYGDLETLNDLRNGIWHEDADRQSRPNKGVAKRKERLRLKWRKEA
jgi:hypothetical protein